MCGKKWFYAITNVVFLLHKYIHYGRYTKYTIFFKGEAFIMEHSPMMKYLGMVTWLVTALASINMLTGMYEYNALVWIGNMVPALVIPLCWIIGLSGIISFVMLVKAIIMCSTSGCDSCGCSGACSCK